MSINGLPLHPLAAHLVVVLLPLAALGTLAVVAVPRWRWYAPVVAVVVTVAGLALPLASQSGETLAERVGEPGLHERLGEQLLWIGLALAALVWVLVAVERTARRRRDTAELTAPRRGAPALLRVVAVLTVAVALVTGVQVVRVGDAGARAACGSVAAASIGTAHAD